ncbi:MAG: hypothetical protein P8Z79_19050, partial [Sedimentisphaerales bacterium]
ASMGERFTVRIYNEHLGFDMPGLIIFELMDPPEGSDRWYIRFDERLSIQFIRDRSGTIVELRFYEPGYTHRMIKISI